jgi:hypothetical protein
VWQKSNNILELCGAPALKLRERRMGLLQNIGIFGQTAWCHITEGNLLLQALNFL